MNKSEEPSRSTFNPYHKKPRISLAEATTDGNDAALESPLQGPLTSQGARLQGDQQVDTKSSATNQKEAAKPAQSTIANTDLPYWQRLPSMQLSHGSAEVLTVEECIQHATLYQGKPVRITAQLYQRSFVDNDNGKVLLELMDPCGMEVLEGSPRSVACATPTPDKSLHSAMKTPAKSAMLKTPSKTPTLGMRKSNNSSLLLQSSNKSSTKLPLSSARRKRPWFATSSKNPSTTSSTFNKKTPTKSSTRQNSILKVLVDPELPGLSSIVVSCKVMVWGVLMIENGNGDGTNVFVEARFVSWVDPSTDMSFYMKALQKRRCALYQRHWVLHPGDNGDNQLTTILGCGPPPYARYRIQAEDSKK